MSLRAGSNVSVTRNARLTLLKFLLLSLLSIPLVAQVSTVAFSEGTDAVPAFSSSGAVSLLASHRKLDIKYPRGKKERYELTVLYDPATGFYLWNMGYASPHRPNDVGVRLKIMKAQGTVEFVDATGIVQFDFADGLFVKTWRGRAANMDAAVEASTNEIRQGLPIFEGVSFHRDYKLVPIFGPLIGFDAKIPAGYKPLPREFYCEPFNAFCPSDNQIVSVSKQGNTWKLVVRNRFDVEVILDQNLDLVSTRQLTQPKKQAEYPGLPRR